MRIAMPTNDGVTVAQHFGRARYFWVAEIEGHLVAKEERRENAHVHHSHGEHGGLVQLLSDVNLVICQNLGMRIYNDLVSAGIPVYISRNMDIQRTINDYINGSLSEISSKGMCGGKHRHDQSE